MYIIYGVYNTSPFVWTVFKFVLIIIKIISSVVSLSIVMVLNNVFCHDINTPLGASVGYMKP